jgi:hypothetical protein
MASKTDIATFNAVILEIEQHLSDLGLLREMLDTSGGQDSDDCRDGRKARPDRSCGTKTGRARPGKTRVPGPKGRLADH